MAPGVVRQGDHRMITLMKWGTYLEDHPNKSVILVITHPKQWGHAIKWGLSNGYQPATGMILQVARWLKNEGAVEICMFLQGSAQVGVTETQYFLMSQTLGAAILGPQVQFLVVRVLELGARVFENFWSFYRDFLAFYGHFGAFYGDFLAFYGHFGAFYGYFLAFYGHFWAFYGDFLAFYGHFWAFYGDFLAFYGCLVYLIQQYSHLGLPKKWVVYSPHMAIIHVGTLSDRPILSVSVTPSVFFGTNNRIPEIDMENMGTFTWPCLSY